MTKDTYKFTKEDFKVIQEGILNKVKEIDPSSANFQILVDKFGTTDVDTISKAIYEILWNDLKGKTFKVNE